MRRFVTIPVSETHRCVVWYPFPLISYFQIISSNPCISCKKTKIQTLFIITSALFCGAEQIKDWMFPCIMCTQNPDKRNELEQFMELNNVMLSCKHWTNRCARTFSCPSTYRGELHKNVLFPFTVEFLMKLYCRCAIIDGRRSKEVMEAVIDIMRQSY